MTHIVIPARLASTRLPRKVLLDIAGEPMLAHVVRHALSAQASSVVVSAPEEEVLSVARGLGAMACQTDERIPSGSARAASVAEKLGWSDDDTLLVLQADEPLLPTRAIQQCAETLLKAPHADMATLVIENHDVDAFANPNVVKAVINQEGRALYFSRAGIPAYRTAERGVSFFQHVGIYAYRVGFLRALYQKAPSEWESRESLEQLRALWYGAHIQVSVIPNPPILISVDTAEDLEAVRDVLR